MSEKIPHGTDEQWRALVWAFVWFITEGGPDRFAALQAAKCEIMKEVRG